MAGGVVEVGDVWWCAAGVGGEVAVAVGCDDGDVECDCAGTVGWDAGDACDSDFEGVGATVFLFGDGDRALRGAGWCRPGGLVRGP